MKRLLLNLKNKISRKPVTVTASGIVGMILAGFVFLLAIVGTFYTPYDPEKMDAAAKNLAPCLKHLLGTDNYGRDLLSRIMDGAGTTFFVGLATIAIGGTVGTIVGALTGYFGGIFDEILMRFNDGLLAFPSILLALVLISVFGRGEGNVILALGILFIPSIARVVRGEYLKHRELDYVKNARLLGIGHLRIMFVHILPNIVPTLLVTLTIGFNNAVLAEAGLSYLGLGVLPPKASLGRMLSDSQSYLRLCPWTVVFPGLTIVFAVLGVTLVQEMATGSARVRKLTKAEKTAAASEREAFSEQEENAFRKESEQEYSLPVSEIEKTPTVLRVRNLKVGYYGRTKELDTEILHGVSFDLRPGETLGIVGESGSGKSTAALAVKKLLAGSAWTSGSIVADSDISMIFQEALTALNPVKKIGTQLRTALRLREKGLSKTEEHARLVNALLEVDLNDAETVLTQYPHELSGGMRQRVLIATALLHKPGILIADEPTTALDAETQEEILALLKKLQEKYRMAVIFISHDLGLVRRLCDRVLVMNHGRIVERGTAEHIFEHPENDYTKQLMRSSVGEDFTKKLTFPKTRDKAVSVEHLTVRFGKHRHFGKPAAFDKEVISDLSFTVNRGDVFGILGRSGTGKTTIAKSILGLLPENASGTVSVNGTIGMVFQDPYSSLNRAKTVGWLLSEAGRSTIPKEERKKEAFAMLSAIGLPEEYYDRPVTMLSGGERQRVAIGMTMMRKPDIVILDEPVSALDVTVSEQILGLLTEFHNRYGLTYLLISHDESVIKRMVTAELRL